MLWAQHTFEFIPSKLVIIEEYFQLSRQSGASATKAADGSYKVVEGTLEA